MANVYEIAIGAPQDQPYIVDFQIALALETEAMQLDKDIVQAGVSRLFKANSPGFYVITKVEQAPVACLLVLSEWSDWRNREVWWIHSVFVDKNHRRKGLYQRMYQWVKQEAVAKDVAGLRLYVDRGNKPAQKTYTALGMTDQHYAMFEEMIEA